MEKEVTTVYIVISQTGTLFSRLLKIATQTPYNHVSISFDKDLRLMYSFARRKIYFPWIAGFIEECPTEGMFKRKPKTECSVYALKLTMNQYQKMLESLAPFLMNPKPYRYNFLGLPFMWLGIPFERRYHYVCSQFVGRLLQDSGVIGEEYASNLMRPYDFAKLKQAELVYQGRLKDYSVNRSSDVELCGRLLVDEAILTP